MTLFPRAALLLAVVGLVAVANQAEAQKNKKSKKEHLFHGVVVDVEHAKGSKQGTITVKHHRHGQKAGKQGAGLLAVAKQKAGAGAQGTVEKTFTINAHTHVRSSGQGKAHGKLHKGAHVVVHYHGDHADVIQVVHRSKQNQKK